eukprot:4839346-Prymnesium_polylepis.1
MMKLFRHATRHLTGSVLTADQSLFITFIVATVKVVLWMQIVPILVEQIEIAVDSIVAILGALTVGVGPALKPLAENFVMGAVLTWVRPFKIGDLVEISSGVLGIVQTTSLAYTTVKNPSGQIVHVPNSKIALMPMIDRRCQKDACALVLCRSLGLQRTGVGPFELSLSADVAGARRHMLPYPRWACATAAPHVKSSRGLHMSAGWQYLRRAAISLRRAAQ